MLVRMTAATGLIVAGLGLSACQTTGIYTNEAAQACQDYGLSPGMAGYEDCVSFVQQTIIDHQREYEDEYGIINARIDCDVTEIRDGTVYGVCELVDYDWPN